VKAVIAIDLDQTMIFSARSAGDLEGIDVAWVEELDGEPLSLMSAAAHAQLIALCEQHHVVPVTTRTPEQLVRVRLPGSRTHAICANGGVLIVGGVRDQIWDRRVAADLRAVAPASVVARMVDAPWARTIRQVEDLFLYLVAPSREDIPADWLAEVGLWCAARGWSVSVQGRKVYLVPQPLDKGSAALRVAATLGGPLLAAGDSQLDAALLAAAAFAIRPAHGELHDLGDFSVGVQVTASSGVRASEEILEALAAQAEALTAAS
jgi:hypothetical protein